MIQIQIVALSEEYIYISIVELSLWLLAKWFPGCVLTFAPTDDDELIFCLIFLPCVHISYIAVQRSVNVRSCEFSWTTISDTVNNVLEGHVPLRSLCNIEGPQPSSIWAGMIQCQWQGVNLVWMHGNRLWKKIFGGTLSWLPFPWSVQVQVPKCICTVSECRK